MVWAWWRVHLYGRDRSKRLKGEVTLARPRADFVVEVPLGLIRVVRHLHSGLFKRTQQSTGVDVRAAVEQLWDACDDFSFQFEHNSVRGVFSVEKGAGE